jgi:hypothetical protein
MSRDEVFGAISYAITFTLTGLVLAALIVGG